MNPSTRKKAVVCISLLVMLITFATNYPKIFSGSTVQAMSTQSPKVHRILCYGDSLTAGTSGMDLHPYAPYLESAFNKRGGDRQVVVRHRGLPGWTAKQMLEDLDGGTSGLRSAIQAIKDPGLSVVIILAGTNDLGYGSSEKQITDAVLGLHSVAWDNGVLKTIAIGVPPSGYTSANEHARHVVEGVNTNLEKACAETDRAIFMPFPFEFERGGENWYLDTLHFSEKGYQVLGESLVTTLDSVLAVLDEKSSDQSNET
jgi:lysophospholipase L1-like esterase